MEDSSSPVADVELTVACLCVSVETAAHSIHEVQTPLEIYASVRWSYALERELDAAARWSVQRDSHLRKRIQQHQSQSHSNPMIQAMDLERLVASTTSKRLTSTLTTQLRQAIAFATDIDNAHVPPRFQLTRTEEVEAETRYCANGRPQPLRYNVLGERYATRDRPLAFLTRHSDATEIFRRMRPRVKQELRLRETRRIERLNAQHRREAQSPEDALEAKLDRIFHAKASIIDT